MTGAYEIRMANDADLARIIEYLTDQLRDSGVNGTPLFQPYGRGGADWSKTEKLEQWRREIVAPIGVPPWRRFWLAHDHIGEIAGHIDLRSRPDPNTGHRALLGMGVHRDHRRRGIGRMLLDFVFAWAGEHSKVEWIDLSVLAGNVPAQSLYQNAGFKTLGTVEDMFRVDGESVGDILMTRRVRMEVALPKTG